MKKFIFIHTNACQHKIHEMIWHNIKAACRTKILFAYREEKNHIHNCHIYRGKARGFAYLVGTKKKM